MSNKTNENGVRKFGMMDKLAYAAGDFGCNMSFALKSYLMVYWTQYMGMTESLYALLLVIVQVWDAINDPLIGAMIDSDRRQYKRNKFLTYISVGSIGLIIAGALSFFPLNPASSDVVKAIVYIAGYVFWDAFYTVANVPYGSMLPLITTDAAERAQLSSWRNVGAMVGGMGAGVIIPMLIYGEDNNIRGNVMWMIALFMGVLGFAAFRFFVAKTVIRVNTDITVSEEAPKFNMLVAIKNFCKNRAALGVTFAAAAMFLSQYGASAASTVMFQSYFGNAQISGMVSLIAMLPMFLFMPFISKIVRKFGKKEAASFGSIFSVIATVLMLILPITPDGQGLMIYMGCLFLNGLGMGVNTCVSYSMMADAIDYNDWKFGVRDEGTIYAIHSFFRKLSQGVSPSIGLMVAVSFGYVAANGANQPAEVALAMRYIVAAMYCIATVIQFVCITFVYNIDKKTLAQMTEELAARKAK